jgi:hypothetical protein
MPTDEQAKNIQGVGIAGFRKDHQLIAIRIDHAQDALRLLGELAERTANAWEVKRFNDLFSEIRGSEAEESIEATWLATLISASGFAKLGVDLNELPAGEGCAAFKAGMAARASQIGDTRVSDAPTQWLPEFRADHGGVDLLLIIAARPRRISRRGLRAAAQRAQRIRMRRRLRRTRSHALRHVERP